MAEIASSQTCSRTHSFSCAFVHDTISLTGSGSTRRVD
jgi:hypothetical protein